jgi:uncharacterized membrane protein YoaK (UPF0700 family)
MKLPSAESCIQYALAICLALISGYLDGYGLLILGVYVSFMSGNTTISGLRSGQGNFHAAWPSVIAILFFVSGSFLGHLFTQSRWRHSHRLIFGLITMLLLTVTGLERKGVLNPLIAVGILSLAMGMMNPALTKIGAESVSLTFMTGTLNRIGGHLASTVGLLTLTDAQTATDSHLSRARVEASVWLGFLVGAALAGIATSHFRNWALLPPCVVMLGLTALTDIDRVTQSREKVVSALPPLRAEA